MKTLTDPANALAPGLAAIRGQFKIPDGFPPEAMAAAEAATKLKPTEHVDRTAIPFVTLDPEGSTDLDQAFFIEAAGSDLFLRYAIADVAWFVRDGDALDLEAWQRGETYYLPDGRASLYPTMLSEGAASLLPDGDRPAVIFSVRLSPEGAASLDGVERAIVRNRAKLAYETARESDLPEGFAEFARRMTAAEDRRGASRVDPPEQEVRRLEDGAYQLSFRPNNQFEDQNATLSLATNMAVADTLLAHKTGLFRVMSEPDQHEVAALRNSARALGLDWPKTTELREFQKSLNPDDPHQAALMLEIRRASPGASYMPYKDGVTPWHSAVAATYAHATAPLRRLADRYVISAALAVANGKPVDETTAAAFEKLPKVMARADGRAAQINAAVINLAEAVMLQSHVGQTFAATVIDLNDRGAKLQLSDLPVVAYIAGNGLQAGETVKTRLTSAEPAERRTTFEMVDQVTTQTS